MIALADRRTPSMENLLALARSRWLWCFFAVAFLLVRTFAAGKAGLTVALGDPDDATRLIEVRALLDGAGWYNLTLAKIGGATPLLSHWSRLIDAPLAILLILFGFLMAPDQAELATRIVWPSLLLLVFFRLLVSESEARGGFAAGILCLLFALACMTGLFQFRVGRIDHHNAMILGAVGGVLMLARGLEQPRLGSMAGVMLGLSLAVGYEPLAMVLPIVAIASAAAAIDTRFIDSVATALKSMAATMLAAMLLTIAPSRWGVATCDALSINMVLLVGCGALGLHVIAGRHSAWTTGQRLAALAVTGAVACAAFLAPDTACMAGPFGQVSSEAKRLWLVNVRETQSLIDEVKSGPLLAASFIMFVAAGVWAAVSRWRKVRTTEAAATAVVMLCAIPPAVLQLKFLPYASWLATFAIALRVASFEGGGQMTPRAARLAGLLAFNQWSLALATALVLMAAGVSIDVGADDGADACYKTDNVRPLAALPPGLVASSINLGPYIAALTPHSVIAAPYHRIDGAIVGSIRLFEGSGADARQRLQQDKIRYVAFCAAERRKPTPTDARQSFENALASGPTPEFLRELPGVSPLANLRIFEVLPAVR